ncbi:MAG: hypothetical protein LBT69_04065 [Lactobacillales bacterium]|jgi:hypothetical protein|nr:hypothetical protein [Lactobacillales bacterium]
MVVKEVVENDNQEVYSKYLTFLRNNKKNVFSFKQFVAYKKLEQLKKEDDLSIRRLCWNLESCLIDEENENRSLFNEILSTQNFLKLKQQLLTFCAEKIETHSNSEDHIYNYELFFSEVFRILQLLSTAEDREKFTTTAINPLLKKVNPTKISKEVLTQIFSTQEFPTLRKNLLNLYLDKIENYCNSQDVEELFDHCLELMQYLSDEEKKLFTEKTFNHLLKRGNLINLSKKYKLEDENWLTIVKSETFFNAFLDKNNPQTFLSKCLTKKISTSKLTDEDFNKLINIIKTSESANNKTGIIFDLLRSSKFRNFNLNDFKKLEIPTTITEKELQDFSNQYLKEISKKYNFDLIKKDEIIQKLGIYTIDGASDLDGFSKFPAHSAKIFAKNTIPVSEEKFGLSSFEDATEDCLISINAKESEKITGDNFPHLQSTLHFEKKKEAITNHSLYKEPILFFLSTKKYLENQLEETFIPYIIPYSDISDKSITQEEYLNFVQLIAPIIEKTRLFVLLGNPGLYKQIEILTNTENQDFEKNFKPFFQGIQNKTIESRKLNPKIPFNSLISGKESNEDFTEDEIGQVKKVFHKLYQLSMFSRENWSKQANQPIEFYTKDQFYEKYNKKILSEGGKWEDGFISMSGSFEAKDTDIGPNYGDDRNVLSTLTREEKVILANYNRKLPNQSVEQIVDGSIVSKERLTQILQLLKEEKERVINNAWKSYNNLMYQQQPNYVYFVRNKAITRFVIRQMEQLLEEINSFDQLSTDRKEKIMNASASILGDFAQTYRHCPAGNYTGLLSIMESLIEINNETSKIHLAIQNGFTDLFRTYFDPKEKIGSILRTPAEANMEIAGVMKVLDKQFGFDFPGFLSFQPEHLIDGVEKLKIESMMKEFETATAAKPVHPNPREYKEYAEKIIQIIAKYAFTGKNLVHAILKNNSEATLLNAIEEIMTKRISQLTAEERTSIQTTEEEDAKQLLADPAQYFRSHSLSKSEKEKFLTCYFLENQDGYLFD